VHRFVYDAALKKYTLIASLGAPELGGHGSIR